MKKLIALFLPPIFLKALNHFKTSEEAFDFTSWWNDLSNKERLPDDLVIMIDYFVKTPAFLRSSQYWNWLNAKNIQQIYDFGYDNFKQTVAKNYFTWVGQLDTQYSKNLIGLAENLSVEIPTKEVFRRHQNFSHEESVLYNLVTILLLQFVIDEVGEGFLDLIEEPTEGNPPYLLYKNHRISQDILNSMLEFNAISKGYDLEKANRILEVGAGSGRTAFTLLKLFPTVKYIIVDIPPALFISQSNLSNVFSDKKKFLFRPFTSFKEIEEEFNSADLVFPMPDQLDLLPEKIVDLFLAIDCLHEMKQEQIDGYFDQANRLAHQIYFKCWEKTTVPFDEITFSENSYPIMENWHEMYRGKCKVPSEFFEAVYEIK